MPDLRENVNCDRWDGWDLWGEEQVAPIGVRDDVF